jgi:hypothetical protein
MTDPRYADFRALRDMVLADLSQAGILADWLQENGREKSADLLREKLFLWHSWKEIILEMDPETIMGHTTVREVFGFMIREDRDFRRSIRSFRHTRIARRRAK